MNQLERIAQTLEQNEIKFDRKFLKLFERGYASDDCQSLSEEIVGEVETLVKLCVNEGFSAERKDAIEELIALALKLSEKKSAEKYVKLCKEKDDILKKVSLTPEKRAPELDVKGKVLSVLASSSEAIETVERINKGDRIKANLQTSRQLLEQLSALVRSVWDNASRTSVDYASDLLAQVKIWQEQIVAYTCDSEGLSALKKAIEIAETWKQNNVAPKRKRDLADEKYVSEKLSDGNATEVERITDSTTILEKIQIFCERLDAYKQETEERYSPKQVEKRIEELNARKAEIAQKGEEIKARLQNDEISKQTAISYLTGYRDELEGIEEDLISAEEDCAELRIEYGNRTANSREFARLVDKLREFEQDPVMLATLAKVSDLDFVELSNALLGRMYGEQTQTLVTRLLSLFEMMKLRGGKTEEVRQGFREIRSELRIGASLRTGRKTAQKTEQEQNDEIDSLLGAIGAGGGKKKKIDVPMEEEETNIPLGDGDEDL